MALRHASSQFLGLGIPHPFWEQGIAKLRLFLELASAGNMEAKLIQTSLELLQLELGSASNLFNLPYERWHSLGTDCWLKSLWQFIDFADIQLSPELSVIPTPPCLGDTAIMDCVLLSPLPLASILAINHCRIAHRAFFWSDIVTGRGDAVSPDSSILPARRNLAPGYGLRNHHHALIGQSGHPSFEIPHTLPICNF